ncbi:SDR family NAD(P)-dependent oxidoreductase [Paenibacillus sp. V4I5]|uniref:SDR family NAD(P)-dependent oxidoreductase n=1 Tax=Paenibacillus sp. V4I5 TaxID=3042306 RepID=UPI00278DFB88|nr:SDR family oxidoreductase [Paenibacillus sp. V4I5]MDQ0915027.1 glucose 1-dehydrogenase [Paenibacillus sp. V4I5]
MSGKTALVTGGSRGIGRGIALAMAARGYDIAICHWKDADNAHLTAREIENQLNRQCVVFEGNLEEEEEPLKLAKEAIRTLGHLDVLVNNAGVTIFQNAANMELEKINRLLHLDLRAPLLLMQLVSSHMIEHGVRGSILNITSTRGERAYPGDAVYGGVKAALTRVTASIALDLAPYGIRVNCIAPGAIQTNDNRSDYYRKFGQRIPLERPGTPEDIGKAAVWLTSDEASYITGTTIRVDGGLILPGMPETEEGIGWS